mmetsp:Transcript_17633/g.52985  ORF Transcript_17633/g.52985 Transcript_17633/m.52985 type:complete len:95 (-) Transcript_17633:32-316(-)
MTPSDDFCCNLSSSAPSPSVGAAARQLTAQHATSTAENHRTLSIASSNWSNARRGTPQEQCSLDQSGISKHLYNSDWCPRPTDLPQRAIMDAAA